MNSVYQRSLKRLFDIGVASALLFCAAPAMVVIACLLKLCQGSVFFVQRRPGLNMQEFPMLKFCTMSDAKDEQGNLLEDEDRITLLGKILRKTSLDELPQLINVIRGEMSIVGPRPQLGKYINRCNSTQLKRQNVRPGITGLAQVKGRNSLKWEHRFKYDVFYAEHVSFWMDVKILFSTFLRVIKADGVEYDGRVADHEFLGVEKEKRQESKTVTI